MHCLIHAILLWDTALPSIVQTFTPTGAMAVSWQKAGPHIFLWGPLGLLSHGIGIHFSKAIVKSMLRPIRYDTLQLAVLDIFAVIIWDLGPLGVPQRGDFVSEIHIYHRAKFHADRCNRRRDTQTDRITADLISDKTNTSVAFVDKIQIEVRHIVAMED